MTLSTSELASMLDNNPALRKKNPDVLKQLHKRSDNSASSATNKFGNHKVYVYTDGFVSDDKKLTTHGKIVEKYDSVKEFERYQALKLLQRCGQISDLHRQVKFVIQESFVHQGERVGEIAYVADHVYVDREGQTVVEDVKGINKHGKPVTATKEFNLKWKLLKAKHPDKKFIIV